MVKVSIPVDLMLELATEIRQHHNTSALLKDALSAKMNGLENVWVDAGQQQFFRYFRELEQQLEITQEMLNTLSKELENVATRYANVGY